MRVDVRLLGGFAVVLDGRVVPAEAWARRHAASLVKLLALSPGRRLHREQVLEALWPGVEPAPAAARLHKAAHYARKALAADAAVVLAHDMVALLPDADVTVDAVVFEESARRGEVDAALAVYGGELLPEDRYEEWAFIARERLQLRYRELLRATGRWDELVALDPTDEEAHVAIMQRLLDAGDRAGARRRFETLERVLHEELGIGPSPEAVALYDAAHEPAMVLAPVTRDPRHSDLATQSIRFCTTPDGVRLAYAVSGAGPPLVKASNWLTHLDYDWHSPVWRHWWQHLSRHHTLIRYDERGCGLSDWDVDDFTLDAWVRDLETVVDTLGLERFPLLGISQGAPVALRYAARHPGRVSRVIVYGTCIRSAWERADELQRREYMALFELVRASWGADNAAFRQVYNTRFLPDGPIEAWKAFDELQRISMSSENAARLWRAFGFLDWTADASRVSAPSLVMHARGDQLARFTEAEELARAIPGSRLVPLDSNNHILQENEPAFARFLDEVERFLAA